MTKKMKISFILNLLIFVFVLGCTLFAFIAPSPIGAGFSALKYFTVQSNILAGVIGIIFVIYYILIWKKKEIKIPKLLHAFKFIVTVDLVLTFFTVLLFLAPFSPTGFFSLYVYTNFFFHLIIPILTVVSFVFFENEYFLNFKFSFIGMVHMIIYGVFYSTVALTHIGENGKPALKFDWYGFAQNGVWGIVIVIITIYLVTFLFSFALVKLNNLNKKISK